MTGKGRCTVWAIGVAALLAVVLCAAPAPARTKAEPDGPNRFSMGLGMDVGMVVPGHLDTLPPGALFFQIPFEFRHSFNPWFAAGGTFSVIVWHSGGSGTTGGALFGASIRPYLVPDWLFVDLTVGLEFIPFFVFNVQPTLGLSIPVSDSLALKVEARVPILLLPYMGGGYILLVEPAVGLEWKF